MRKKLKMTNQNVRFLDDRALSAIRGGFMPAECTEYCVKGDKYFGTASPTKKVKK